MDFHYGEGTCYTLDIKQYIHAKIWYVDCKAACC
jgi:hypothetical protein